MTLRLVQVELRAHMHGDMELTRTVVVAKPDEVQAKVGAWLQEMTDAANERLDVRERMVSERAAQATRREVKLPREPQLRPNWKGD